MNDIQKRFSMFLLGCIPARLLFTYVSKNYKKYGQIQGYIGLIIGIGFMYIFITGSRKTGMEVQGGKIWWNCLRPFHSAMYLLFAYYTIHLKNNDAWKFLFLDTLVGLGSFLIYHCKHDNLKQLI
jgi:hypothetical protein